jgi:phosphoglycerate dehydrogenase-like enzyme
MPRSRRDDDTVLLLNVDSHRKIWNLPPGTLEEIASRFAGLKVVRTSESLPLRAAIPQADILYTWGLPREAFPLARRLKWVHTPAAGVDHLLYPAFVQSDVLLTNSRGLAGDAMADHAFSLILALARRLPEAVRFQSQHRWGQETLWTTPPPPIALHGKVLGIVGLGGVGIELAARARAFGMTVLATRRSSGKHPSTVSKVLAPDQLPDLLEASDFVVLCPPLTQQTRGMIGRKELRRMKKTGYLVNVGRGELIQEAALITALREGWIAGAALDVFATEPLPRNSVFWNLPGLLITPHYAGTYPEHVARATALFLENLKYFLAGKRSRLKNLVDKSRGY